MKTKSKLILVFAFLAIYSLVSFFLTRYKYYYYNAFPLMIWNSIFFFALGVFLGKKESWFLWSKKEHIKKVSWWNIVSSVLLFGLLLVPGAISFFDIQLVLLLSGYCAAGAFHAEEKN